MNEVFKVINEFEARVQILSISVMYFNTQDYEIYRDELEEFEQEGYIVKYLGNELRKNVGFVDKYSITK